METEIWKDIDGFNGKYQVSNFGRVKSNKFRCINKEFILKQSRNSVSLGSKPYTRTKVDLLVAKAFLPKAKTMEVVEHINGNQYDNNAKNLKWSKLTAYDVLCIKCSKNAKMSENEWYENDGCVYFKLSNSKEYGICDKEVWEIANAYRWMITPEGYIVSGRNNTHKRFHHLVLKPKNGYVIDHINRNKLDNRKSNLRYASPRANAINHSVRKDNNTGKCGVRKLKDGRFQAYIWSGKQIDLGKYDKYEDALIARLNAEEKYFAPIIDRETHI